MIYLQMCATFLLRVSLKVENAFQRLIQKSNGLV